MFRGGFQKLKNYMKHTYNIMFKNLSAAKSRKWLVWRLPFHLPLSVCKHLCALTPPELKIRVPPGVAIASPARPRRRPQDTESKKQVCQRFHVSVLCRFGVLVANSKSLWFILIFCDSNANPQWLQSVDFLGLNFCSQMMSKPFICLNPPNESQNRETFA